MILKPNINSHRRFSNKFIVLFLFIILIVFLGIYHTIESVKNSPIASTDKNVYQVGESITLKIKNRLPEGIKLDNCNSFEIEIKNVDGSWKDISDGLICKQDKIVSIFSNREAFFSFVSIKPGTVRIHVNYKLHRSSGKINIGDTYTPVYQFVLYSNEFKIN